MPTMSYASYAASRTTYGVNPGFKALRVAQQSSLLPKMPHVSTTTCARHPNKPRSVQAGLRLTTTMALAVTMVPAR